MTATAPKNGAKVKHELGLIKAAAYSMPAAQVAKQDDSDIIYVTPDRKIASSGYNCASARRAREE